MVNSCSQGICHSRKDLGYAKGGDSEWCTFANKNFDICADILKKNVEPFLSSTSGKVVERHAIKKLIGVLVRYNQDINLFRDAGMTHLRLMFLTLYWMHLSTARYVNW